MFFSGNPPPTKIKILNKKQLLTSIQQWILTSPVPGQSPGPTTKNPSTGLGTHPETHGLLTPGRTTTSRHSRNQSCAVWPPAPGLDGGVCGVAAFRQIFFKGRKPVLRGVLEWKIGGHAVFFCVFWEIQMKRWNSRTTSRASLLFLIYMHCAWHCPT